MGAPKSWLCSILAAILLLGIARAAPANPPEPQRSFASAEEAAKAFVAALRDNKKAELRAILGPEADRVVNSGDRYADQERHQHFIALYDEKHVIDQKSPGRAELSVGPNDWPLPIPLVESNGRWMFDTNAGAQTIVDRRIGRNELSAIRTLLACVDAQHDYFERAKQASGSGVYATRLVSTPGRHDGLYWPVPEGETESPLGPLIDAAQDAGYPGELIGGKPSPYEGYLFSNSQGTRSKRGWWRQVVYAVGPHDRRLRIDRVAGGIWVKRDHDVYRRPGWRCVSERPRSQDREHRRGDDGVRPRPYMVTCRGDERVTRNPRPPPAILFRPSTDGHDLTTVAWPADCAPESVRKR